MRGLVTIRAELDFWRRRTHLSTARDRTPILLWSSPHRSY